MKHHITFYAGTGLQTCQTIITVDAFTFSNVDMLALSAITAAAVALGVKPDELRLTEHKWHGDGAAERIRAAREWSFKWVDMPDATPRPIHYIPQPHGDVRFNGCNCLACREARHSTF